jgi:hypothetical protein
VSSGFRVAFHLPGMTILLPKMSNYASPPAEPGVYLDANYNIASNGLRMWGASLTVSDFWLRGEAEYLKKERSLRQGRLLPWRLA